jgi:hypothetical protein
MMGGSGGGYFSSSVSPEELARKTREAEQAAQDAQFETEVQQFFADELAQYNQRDKVGTQQVFDAVKEDLKDGIEGTVELLYGGSISKHTYIDGLSDVDALVLFDRKEVTGQTPRELRKLLADCLRARYGKNAVQVGTLAVTLTHQEQTLQLLPAIRDGRAFKIASSDGKQWSKINPRTFAGALTKANKAMDGKLVPCVKLAKAIIATLPEKRRLTGYHTESLAINIFKDYSGPKTTRAMLHHFFERAAAHVRQPVVDSTGQSVHVDEYLGPANSLPRRIVGDSMNRVARRMKNADGARSVARWRELFE